MKHSRVTAGSLAAVLSPLAGLAAWVAGPLAGAGADMPFPERVISTAADNAYSVFAKDLDGDGDTNILSASLNGDKIAWYESDLGAPGPSVCASTPGCAELWAGDPLRAHRLRHGI